MTKLQCKIAIIDCSLLSSDFDLSNCPTLEKVYKLGKCDFSVKTGNFKSDSVKHYCFQGKGVKTVDFELKQPSTEDIKFVRDYETEANKTKIMSYNFSFGSLQNHNSLP